MFHFSIDFATKWENLLFFCSRYMQITIRSFSITLENGWQLPTHRCFYLSKTVIFQSYFEFSECAYQYLTVFWGPPSPSSTRVNLNPLSTSVKMPWRPHCDINGMVLTRGIYPINDLTFQLSELSQLIQSHGPSGCKRGRRYLFHIRCCTVLLIETRLPAVVRNFCSHALNDHSIAQECGIPIEQY